MASSTSTSSAKPSSAPSISALTDELRALFDRGEHESLVVRADQLLKRKRLNDPATRNTIDAARAASLIHLGRSAEAAPILALLETKGPDAPAAAATSGLVKYAKHYLAWVTSEGAAESVADVKQFSGEDARRLEAQLYYRSGQYDKAAAIYQSLLSTACDELTQRKKPIVASRWRLSAAKPTASPLTAAELAHFESLLNELATNLAAAVVLGGRSPDDSETVRDLPASYELEYNKACAMIHAKDFSAAEVCLEKAEALVRADLDEEEDDIEEAVAPIKVQKTYLQHLAGDVAGAAKVYTQIMADRKADPASLAVAANNLTVALAQLAFGKVDVSPTAKSSLENAGDQDERPVLPKEQHDALVEGLKKMRATSGKTVERKLALNQRRAMARNRAILLVQMGRQEACRAELAKLKSEFPADPLVPLIEASRVVKLGSPEEADRILEGAGDGSDVRAARIQLAAASGKKDRAASLLLDLFPEVPAAIVSAASLLEENGEVDASYDLLKTLIQNESDANELQARKTICRFLLRNSRYRDAAGMLRNIVKADPTDTVAQAQLVVATSYFDASEAQNAVMHLPNSSSVYSNIDPQHLENLPPPKRRVIAAMKKPGSVTGLTHAEDQSTTAKSASVRDRRKKKRKKRVPKNFDPQGPPPDPERWLPKTLRSGYKKKKKSKNEQANFRGSQGADAAAAEAAAVRNAERATAKAAAGAETPSVPSGRSRIQRKKKNRR